MDVNIVYMHTCIYKRTSSVETYHRHGYNLRYRCRIVIVIDKNRYRISIDKNIDMCIEMAISVI